MGFKYPGTLIGDRPINAVTRSLSHKQAHKAPQGMQGRVRNFQISGAFYGICATREGKLRQRAKIWQNVFEIDDDRGARMRNDYQG